MHFEVTNSGPNHRIYQQRQMLLSMGQMLQTGVEITKHGRNGAPKQRMLFCDSTMTKLYWRNLGSKADPEDSELSPEALASSILTAHKKSRRRSSITGKVDADRELLFREIESVRDEIFTEVMHRAYSKNHFLDISQNMRLISIILPESTLDFEIAAKDFENMYHALLCMVQYFKMFINHDS